MARRSANRAAYEDYSIKDEDRDDSTFLGTVGNGVAMLYHEATHTVFEGEADEDEETIEPVEGSHRELEAERTVGDEVQRVHQERGWKSLSPEAEKHIDDATKGSNNHK